MSTIRDRILQVIVAGVEKLRKDFDEQTGRFLSGGGWAVTNQDVIYPLALLYRTAHPANPYHASEAILDLIGRAGNALRDAQYEDGSWEFVKVDGSRWGPVYMPWTLYHWIEAYRLVGDRLDTATRERWLTGLRLGFEGVYRELEPFRVHNIPTWNAMSLWRAGSILGERRWQERGLNCIQQAAAAQRPAGFWPEHEGATTLYNLVYVHAIGLFHCFTGMESLRECLRRALEFHLTFTYPDGVPVETIDGRVKYTGDVNLSGFPGFSLFPEGRRYIGFLLDHYRGGGSVSPHLAAAYEHLVEGEETPIPQDAESYVRTLEDKALVKKSGDWFYCLSAVTAPAPASRWGMDRSHFLSLFHRKVGLMVGGGNSKGQPVWSNFNFLGDYIPVGAEFEGDSLRLRYARGEGCVSLSIQSNELASIELRHKGDGTSGLLLHFQPDEPVLVNGTPQASCDVPGPALVEHRGWRVRVPEGARLAYPIRPFNPYARDGAAPPGQVAAILSSWADRVAVGLEVA